MHNNLRFATTDFTEPIARESILLRREFYADKPNYFNSKIHSASLYDEIDTGFNLFGGTTYSYYEYFMSQALPSSANKFPEAY